MATIIELHPVVLALPANLSATGGPRTMRTLLADANDDAQKQDYWDFYKWEWPAVQFVGDADDMEYLTGFYLGRDGNAFLWQFPLDYEARASNGTGIVKTHTDGKRYLFRRYGDVFRPYDRRIFCPVPESIFLYGVSGTGVTVNEFTGEVVNATSDGTADFDFYSPVIFTTNFQELEREPGDAGSSWKVGLREVHKYRVVES